jgi:hypothetical protein
MKRAIAVLLCLLLIPLAVQARARSVSLAIGETLTVTCPGLLSGTIGKQQADLACGSIPTPTSTPTPSVTPTPTVAPTSTPPASPAAWSFAFDGNPAGPQAWLPSDWANTIHSRDRASWQALPTMHAGHGTDCAAPPATHDISNYPDTIFLCRDHAMTAIDGSAGYAAIYLQPPVMVDFAQEAVIRFDVSTLRTTSRDWIDVWVTPFDEQLAAPLIDWLPDLQGEPRRSIHIGMDTSNGKTNFRAAVVQNFAAVDLPSQWTTGYEDFLTPSATTRTTFELRLSRTHLTFGVPGVFNWVDTDIAALDWSRGVVQLGHHSYTPYKDCTAGTPTCGPNTWHWDNLSISRAVLYTILRGVPRSVDATAPTVTFPAAPAGSRLRFMATGQSIELSFDGGQTWQAAQKQAQEMDRYWMFETYWHPLPAGATSAMVRGVNVDGGPWHARDFAIIRAD